LCKEYEPSLLGQKNNKMMEEHICIKKMKMKNEELGSQFKLDSSAIANQFDKLAEAHASTEATATVTDSCCGAAGDVEKTFLRLFDCQDTVYVPTRLCTEKEFDSILDNPYVAKINDDVFELTRRMQAGEITSEQYEEEKKILKLKLPAFVFVGHSTTGKRNNEDTLPSGLAMLDLDHMVHGTPEELYEDKIKWHEKELGIAFVHTSPSGLGLHVGFLQKVGEKTEAAHERIFNMLNLQGDTRLPEGGYDKGVHDASRASFAVPRKHFLYLDRNLLFHRTDDPQLFAAAQAAAATKHSSASKATASSAAAQSKTNGDTTKEAAHIQDDMTQEQAVEIFDRVCTEIADIDIKALDTQNHRHNNLKAVLGTGIAMVVSQELMQKVVEQRMPSYASEAECQTLIGDYYTKYLDPNHPLSKQLGKIRKQVLGLTSKATADDDASDEADTWETRQLQLSDKITKLLPRGLSDTLFGVPRDMKMPVLCAILPAAAAYADGVRVEYVDGTIHYLGLMSAIVGPFASGKGICADRIKPWMKKMNEASKHASMVEEEYKVKKAAADKSKQKPPKDPHAFMPRVPFAISVAELLHRAKNAQGHTLFSFSEELFTVLRTNKRGEWANKIEAYVKSFDRGEWGQQYHSPDSVSGIVNLQYNWVATGTYKTMYKFFDADALEGGLTSRVYFAEMPDTSFQYITKRPQLTATNIAHIDEAVEKLCAANGTVKLPRVCKVIEKWVNNMADKAAAAGGDHAADTFRRRSALIAFRCATVVYLLTGKESKKVVEFAELMVEYVFGGQMHLFAKAFDDTSVKASQEQQRYTVNADIFDKLNKQFTRDDLAKLKPGATVGNLKKLLSEWKRKKEWIVKIGDNTWEKTADYATMLSRGQQPQGYVRDGLR
jgi:hypothetical protein